VTGFKSLTLRLLITEFGKRSMALVIDFKNFTPKGTISIGTCGENGNYQYFGGPVDQCLCIALGINQINFTLRSAHLR
jgi:hypothetical protein